MVALRGGWQHPAWGQCRGGSPTSTAWAYTHGLRDQNNVRGPWEGKPCWVEAVTSTAHLPRSLWVILKAAPADPAMFAQPFARTDVTTLTVWSQAKATFLPPHNKQSETEVLPEKYSLTHTAKYSQQGRFLPHLLVSHPAEQLLSQLARSDGRV